MLEACPPMIMIIAINQISLMEVQLLMFPNLRIHLLIEDKPKNAWEYPTGGLLQLFVH